MEEKIIRGAKPRPRIAIIGEFPRYEQQPMEQMFPTRHIIQSIELLPGIVDLSEIDAIIIGPDVRAFDIAESDNHIICF